MFDRLTGVPETLVTGLSGPRAAEDHAPRQFCNKLIEFLWASLALFDDDSGLDTVQVYRPRPVELYDVAEARTRILRRLAEMPEGGSLDRFLPEPQAVSESVTWQVLRRRSGWASTFMAGLELARQGDVVLAQAAASASIHVGSRSSASLETRSDLESRAC